MKRARIAPCTHWSTWNRTTPYLERCSKPTCVMGTSPDSCQPGQGQWSATERKASAWQGPESISVGEQPSSLSDSRKSL